MTPLSVNVDQVTLIFPGLSKRDRAHVKWNVICFINMIVKNSPAEATSHYEGRAEASFGGGGWVPSSPKEKEEKKKKKKKEKKKKEKEKRKKRKKERR